MKEQIRKNIIKACYQVAEDLHAIQMSAVYPTASDCRNCLHPAYNGDYPSLFLHGHWLNLIEQDTLDNMLFLAIGREPKKTEFRLTKLYLYYFRNGGK